MFQRPDPAPQPAPPDPSSVGFALCELAAETRLFSAPHPYATALLVVRGTLHFRDDAGTCLMAGQGRMVLIPAGAALRVGCCPRRIARDGDDPPVFVRREGWMVADATAGARCDVLLAGARLSDEASGAVETVMISPINREGAGRRAFMILREEIERRAADGVAVAGMLMNACVALALRDAGQAGAVRQSTLATNPAIGRVAAAIRARPALNYDMMSLASAAGMSRATFARQFTAATRMAPMQFVLRARLDAAANMLRATQLPVKAIAADTGFASRSHFSRAFTIAFGCDPTSFRNEVRKG